MLKGRNGIIAVFLLVLLTVIWGSSFILMKKGMFDAEGNPVLSSVHVAGLRISLTFLILLPFAIYFIGKVPKNKLLPIFGVGFFGNAIPAFLFTASEGENGISSSLAGMLNATTPIFTVIIGLVLFGMRLSPVNYVGIFLAFLGSFGLMAGRGTDQLSTEGIYILYVLMATFCYGVSVNLIRYYLKGINPIAIASISFMFIGIPVISWLLGEGIIEEVGKDKAHLIGFGYTAILAFFGTALAVVLFNYLVQITNAVFASTVTYLMPIMAIVWGLIFKEFFTWWYVVAIAVILSGVYLTNKK